MQKIDLNNFELKDNEMLLKVYEHKCGAGDYILGFLSGLNQDGSVPKAFLNWKPNYREVIESVYRIEEVFRSGWKAISYRSGKSQDWVVVEHPEGFRLEIYMSNFFDIMKRNVINEGRIEGMWKWENKKLVEM